MPGRYQTAEQLAETIGGISARTVRSLRFQGLPAVKLGKAFLYDPDKALAWIAAREEVQCPAPTVAPVSSTSTAGQPSTSSGTKAAESNVAALARLTAERLKRSSLPSSANVTSPPVPPVQLIQRATR